MFLKEFCIVLLPYNRGQEKAFFAVGQLKFKKKKIYRYIYECTKKRDLTIAFSVIFLLLVVKKKKNTIFFISVFADFLRS